MDPITIAGVVIAILSVFFLLYLFFVPGRKFYGWVITAACYLGFGIAVGIPYYSMPFFYDYYQKDFGWSRSDITLGFPLAALLTLWVGPLLVHRFSPRKMIMIGTGCTALAYFGFGTMGAALFPYYFFWVLYMIGYIFSGPIPNQVLISRWFSKNRGSAMGIAYVGVGALGGISSKFIAQPLTENFDFQTALFWMGGIMFLAWPLALFVLKDRPADMGTYPDGIPPKQGAPVRDQPKSFSYLLSRPAFWLLVIGSFCSIGSIGAINQHMKLIFQDAYLATPNYTLDGTTLMPDGQNSLNSVFSDALFCIMISSIAGRLIMGWLADRLTKKFVMVITYFLVAATIPLLTFFEPGQTPYLFAIMFGFGLGADYMLIPLMAAEQFGVASLARSMAIILPTDTIGQTWFPYLISVMRDSMGAYQTPLLVVLGVALIGAVAILLLPKPDPDVD